jgi:hypothetical protein
MVRSEFNFDVWFVIYSFFSFNQCCIWLMSSILFSFACMHMHLSFPSATCCCFVTGATGNSTPRDPLAITPPPVV